MQPQLFKDVVGEVIEQIKGEDREDIYRIWKENIPPIVQKHSKLQEVKKDKKKIRLIVAVDSSPWLYNLNFNKKEWKNKIEKELGNRFLIEIKFRIGNLRD
ncbi:MAG: hypothetical protein DRP02_14075 [Candidatus Gerdarchaeota archaeon]|nr:MAG: hypothetical protein DRP02_14075 [Candidatus Gerdarchaeota archaeon]